MGSGHTHRNKRGGRHNRSGPPRASGAESVGGAVGAKADASANVPAQQVPPPPASATARTPHGPTPPSEPQATDAPAQMRREKSATGPSLRAPYAPGQRARRDSRRSTDGEERPAAELEVTAIYEELVVTTRDVEALADREDPWDTGAAGPRAATDASRDQERPTYQHNGHAHDASRRNGRHQERDHHPDQGYTPAHLRAEVERDGAPADSAPEIAPYGGSGREGADTASRGDVRGDVGPLIDDLKSLFQRDRATASATGGSRCGICYLHFALDAMEYREDEGYYVCAACAQALGAARVPMVRRQKRG